MKTEVRKDDRKSPLVFDKQRRSRGLLALVVSSSHQVCDVLSLFTRIEIDENIILECEYEGVVIFTLIVFVLNERFRI